MKPILYLRTSTKDQNPELQRKDGIKFCLDIGLEEPEVFSEKGSAYKLEKVRPIWESIVKIAKKDKRAIIIWKYDRAFRNRKEFFKFMKVMFEVYETKAYSVTEPSILMFWDMMGKFDTTGNPVMDELINGIFKVIWDFMIQQAGEEAEEESRKKSERVKLAVRKENGVTKSYKGNKWGRRKLSKQMRTKLKDCIKSNPKMSMRDIANEIGLSKSAVHKYYKEIEREISGKSGHT